MITKLRYFPVWLVPILLLMAMDLRSHGQTLGTTPLGTVNAVYYFSNLVSQPLNVSRVVVTPLQPGPAWNAAVLGPWIPPYTRANSPGLTNGFLEISNIACGYAFQVVISGGTPTVTITNYFDPFFSNQTVNAANMVAVNFNVGAPFVPCYLNAIVSNIFLVNYSSTNVLFASGTNTVYRQSGVTNIFDVAPGVFDTNGSATWGIGVASNIMVAATNGLAGNLTANLNTASNALMGVINTSSNAAVNSAVTAVGAGTQNATNQLATWLTANINSSSNQLVISLTDATNRSDGWLTANLNTASNSLLGTIYAASNAAYAGANAYTLQATNDLNTVVRAVVVATNGALVSSIQAATNTLAGNLTANLNTASNAILSSVYTTSNAAVASASANTLNATNGLAVNLTANLNGASNVLMSVVNTASNAVMASASANTLTATNQLAINLTANINNASNQLVVSLTDATNRSDGWLTANLNTASNSLMGTIYTASNAAYAGANAYTLTATNGLAGNLTANLNTASNFLATSQLNGTNVLASGLTANLNSASNSILASVYNTSNSAVVAAGANTLNATNQLAINLTANLNTASNSLMGTINTASNAAVTAATGNVLNATNTLAVNLTVNLNAASNNLVASLTDATNRSDGWLTANLNSASNSLMGTIYTASNAAYAGANAYTLQATNDLNTIHRAVIIATNNALVTDIQNATNGIAGNLTANLNNASNSLMGTIYTASNAAYAGANTVTLNATNQLATWLTANVNGASNSLMGTINTASNAAVTVANNFSTAATNALAANLTANLNTASNTIVSYLVLGTNLLASGITTTSNALMTVINTASNSAVNSSGLNTLNATNGLAVNLTANLNTASNALVANIIAATNSGNLVFTNSSGFVATQSGLVTNLTGQGVFVWGNKTNWILTTNDIGLDGPCGSPQVTGTYIGVPGGNTWTNYFYTNCIIFFNGMPYLMESNGVTLYSSFDPTLFGWNTVNGAAPAPTGHFGSDDLFTGRVLRGWVASTNLTSQITQAIFNATNGFNLNASTNFQLGGFVIGPTTNDYFSATGSNYVLSMILANLVAPTNGISATTATNISLSMAYYATNGMGLQSGAFAFVPTNGYPTIQFMTNYIYVTSNFLASIGNGTVTNGLATTNWVGQNFALITYVQSQTNAIGVQSGVSAYAPTNQFIASLKGFGTNAALTNSVFVVTTNFNSVSNAYFNAGQMEVFLMPQALNLIPSMTSSNTPSGNVTASSDDGLNRPYRCFIGNGSLWDAVPGISTNWIQYSFGSLVTVNQTTGVFILGYTNGTMANYSFQYSSDGTNWSTVFTQGLAYNFDGGLTTIFQEITAQYFRWYFTGIFPTGSSSGAVATANLQLNLLAVNAVTNSNAGALAIWATNGVGVNRVATFNSFMGVNNAVDVNGNLNATSISINDVPLPTSGAGFTGSSSTNSGLGGLGYLYTTNLTASGGVGFSTNFDGNYALDTQPPNGWPGSYWTNVVNGYCITLPALQGGITNVFNNGLYASAFSWMVTNIADFTNWNASATPEINACALQGNYVGQFIQQPWSIVRSTQPTNFGPYVSYGITALTNIITITPVLYAAIATTATNAATGGNIVTTNFTSLGWQAHVADSNAIAIGPQANVTYGGAQAGGSGGIALGFKAQGSGGGVSMGYLSSATNQGVAIGNSCNADNVGVSISEGSSGYESGVAVGTDSQGQNTGVGIGNQAFGPNIGVAIGFGCQGSDYGVAIGNTAFGNGSGNVSLGGDINLLGATIPNNFSNTVMLGVGTALINGGLNFYNDADQSGDTSWPVLDANGIHTGNGSGLTNLKYTSLSSTTLTNNTIKGAIFATNVFVYTVPSGVTNNYEACGFVNVTALSVDVINVQVLFTDETGTSQTIALDGNVSATGYNVIASQGFRAKGGTTITMKGNLVTGTGSITYNLGGWLKLAQ